MTSTVNRIKKANTFPIKEYVISIVLSTVAAILLLLLLCVITYKMSDPDSVFKQTAIVALFLSVLIGGAITARITDTKLLGGVIVALWFVILTCVLSLVFGTQSLGFFVSLGIRLALLPVGVAGAMIGAKKDKKKNISKMRKKMRRR